VTKQNPQQFVETHLDFLSVEARQRLWDIEAEIRERTREGV
jgi:hypothetical protein